VTDDANKAEHTEEVQEDNINEPTLDANDVVEPVTGENSEATMAEQLVAAATEIAQLKDQMIRDQAETQNIRKRVQRDVENARKFALEKFVGELLPILDNLDRAIDAAGDAEEVRPVKEGLELTRKSFLQALEKFNVKQINPVGEPFDANFHQAMTMVPNPDMEPNSVMDCMQKGYTLNDRLVRPAMVVVSKAP
jgi:molecular chaperone GrpE